MAKSSDSFVLPQHDQQSGLVPQLSTSDQVPQLGDIARMAASYERSLRGKTAATVESYMTAIRSFVRFLVFAGIPANVETINREHCEAYSEWLEDPNGGNYKGSTPAKYFTGVKMFFAWLVDECEIQSSPFIKRNGKSIEGPKVPERSTVVLSPDQVKDMLATCKGRNVKDPKDFADVRDYAMLRLFWATGCRRDELTQLLYNPNENYDPKVTPHLVLKDIPNTNIGGFVHVLGKGSGKGKRPRSVPFDDDTADAIDRYIRARYNFITALKANKRLRTPYRDSRHADRLWLSANGGKPLGHDGIQALVSNRAKQAGLGHVHPHQLRHSWADNAKRSDMAEADIMSLAGWRNRATMDRYAKSTAVARAHEAYSKFNLGAL